MEDSSVTKAAKELSRLGAAQGGKARAAKLTPEERSLIARRGAAARWGTEDPNPSPQEDLPQAQYGSPDRPLRIGDIEIPCYVLEDGRRVLAQRGMQVGIGMSTSGGTSGAQRMARFVEALERKGLDLKGLAVRIAEPILFAIPGAGGRPAYGYEATILPEICDAVLEARKLGLLQKQQEHIAKQSEILVRGFARVGIIALVDEATGYQDARARDSLAKILEAFVAKELRPWMQTFKPEFYKEIFRLRGLEYTGSPRRPSYIGKLTDDLIYRRLAPGVREELRRVNPTDERGRRKHRHHQWLTEDLGHPKLREHLAAVTAMMRAEDDWQTFKRKLDRVFPVIGGNYSLPLPEPT